MQTIHRHTNNGTLCRWLLFLFLLSAVGMMPRAAYAGDLACSLRYSLAGWSAFYKTAKGSGTVSCSDGESMHVRLRIEGGGLTFGKIQITDGHGKFSSVHTITDVLGHYASAEAHAGADRSAHSQVVTNGKVSLALAGKGRGWNLGVDFGAFIIER